MEQVQKDDGEVELRVAGSTATKELAAAIASHIREGRNVTLVAIGHHAVGQAVKAVPILNGHLAAKGWVFSILPAFEDRQVKDGDVTVPRTVLLLRLVRYSFK